jgi:photosystem II stability/assembly factor-like uncharacterized protein
MFKLNMSAIRRTAINSRLMANAANAANPSIVDPDAADKLATLATLAGLAISQFPQAFNLVATNAMNFDAEPSEIASDWHELDAAYQRHHFNCKTCISAGRGSRYGRRCDTGTALWTRYSATAAHPAEPSSIQKLGEHS